MILSNSWRALLVSIVCTISIGGLSGCTTMNSGLQSGELPPQGTFVAENGMQFNVQPINLLTVPNTNLSNSTASNSTASNSTASNGSDNITKINELLRSSTNTGDYRISPSDIISINLIGYPEITQPASVNASNPYVAGYTVDQQGYIQFPLIGRIKASGLSVPQFTANLRARLQRYLRYPDPQVKILTYRGNKFFIDGEVKQSGEFNITDTPVSVYGALSMAGGTTLTGDSNNLVLTRNGKQYEIGLRNLQALGISGNQIYLQDGDSVHVNSKDRNKVYVLGEFGEVKPLEVPEQGLSLAHVLGESRGLNSTTANAAKIYVVRNNMGAPSANIYYIDMQTVTNLALANRFQMQPDDIVYVDPTGLTRWSRFISLLLPSASGIALLSGL